MERFFFFKIDPHEKQGLLRARPDKDRFRGLGDEKGQVVEMAKGTKLGSSNEATQIVKLTDRQVKILRIRCEKSTKQKIAAKT